MARGDTEVIKEFLVSLGFDVPQGGVRDFTNTLKGVTSVASLAGKVVAGVAVAAEAMVLGFSTQMEKLYYVSRRTKASVSNIQALEFGVEQIGLHADDATHALEGMARAVRMNPGTKGLLAQLGVNPEQDTADAMLDLVEKLSKMPHFVGASFAEMFGMDEHTFLMMKDQLPKLREEAAKRKRMNDEAGFSAKEAAEASMQYKNALREVMEKVEVLGQALTVRLLPAFQTFIDYVNQGVDAAMRFKGIDLKFDLSWGKQFEELGKQLDSTHEHMKQLDEDTSFIERQKTGWSAYFWQMGEWITELTHSMIDLSTASLAFINLDFDAARKAAGKILRREMLREKGELTASEIEVELDKEYAPKPTGKAPLDKKRLATGKIKPVEAPAAPPTAQGGAPATVAPPVQPTPPATTTAPATVGTQAAPATVAPGMATPKGNTLGLRLFNPGNLRNWAEGQEKVGGFVKFSNYTEGLSAMAGNLQKYAENGWNSVRSIIEHWAPAGENPNQASYIANVAKQLGLNADTQLNLKDPAILEKLMGAMIKNEQGMNPFGTNEIRAAIQSRLQGQGVTVHQTTNITVNGATDPKATAQAVDRAQRRVLGDLTRNHVGALAA